MTKQILQSPDTLEYYYYNEKEYVEEDGDWPEDPLNKARLDYFQ